MPHPETKSFIFSGRGKVYSHTTVYDTPEGFDKNAPYTIGIIELEETQSDGSPIYTTAQLTDVDRLYDPKTHTLLGLIDPYGNKVDIGTPVEVVIRHLFDEPGSDGDRRKGMKVYGPKFRPCLRQS